MAKAAVNQLSVSVRTQTGKGASRRSRREGKIPAVIYGHGAEPQHVELPGHDYAAVLRHSGTNAVLTLDIAGKEQLALTKSIDIHPVRRNILHADLVVVRRGEKVVVEVNVIIEGEAGPDTLVTQEASAIEIEAEALSIPEQLTVSIVVNAPTAADLEEEGSGETAEAAEGEEAGDAQAEDGEAAEASAGESE